MLKCIKLYFSPTNHRIIILTRDYAVVSEFTLALFEDSGWYKANYTALYNLKQNPLQWGKGKEISMCAHM